jgi:DNA-binding transcriptional LysR family regulator
LKDARPDRAVSLRGLVLGKEQTGQTSIVEPVLTAHEPPADLISLVYPSSRHLSPKVRAFVDFMIGQFS